MTNYAELIAEVEEWQKGEWPDTINQNIDANFSACGEAEELIQRLAAAVRELAPPEGWRVVEFLRTDYATVNAAGPDWGAFFPTGKMLGIFPTASAAMAALDGEKPGWRETMNKNVWEELVSEARSGGFSILSDKAQAEIINMIDRAMRDGYERGVEHGKQLAKRAKEPKP